MYGWLLSALMRRYYGPQRRPRSGPATALKLGEARGVRSFDLRLAMQGIYGGQLHLGLFRGLSKIDWKKQGAKRRRSVQYWLRRGDIDGSRNKSTVSHGRPGGDGYGRQFVACCYSRAGRKRCLRRTQLPLGRGSGEGDRWSAGVLARAGRQRDIAH